MFKEKLQITEKKIHEKSEKNENSQKTLRWPGIEPGSTAWKAAMLTIIPPTLLVYFIYTLLTYLY